MKKTIWPNGVPKTKELLCLVAGVLLVAVGFAKNFYFLNNDGMDGRLEMGREAIYEIALFGIGTSLILLYLFIRDRSSIIVDTWIATVMVALLMLGCAYAILGVLPT